MEKKWRIYEGGECPRCGNVSEVLTKSTKHNWVYDDEDARCTECGLTGSVSVEDSECADIIWDDFDLEKNKNKVVRLPRKAKKRFITLTARSEYLTSKYFIELGLVKNFGPKFW